MSREMEGVEGPSSAAGRFTVPPRRLNNEDIIFCVDVDSESLVEMKSTGINGRPFTRLDSIKQAILLFVNAKLSINPDHRFAFATLGKTASWVIINQSQFYSFFFLISFHFLVIVHYVNDLILISCLRSDSSPIC